jgi:tRNA (mo5U34)-methyltransferase
MSNHDQESILAKRRREDFSAELAKTGWYHSFELPDGRRVPGFLHTEELRERWGEFPLPPNLEGKRLLDIGTWDGWFAFEGERRGAEVVAVDNVEQENFRYIRRELGSKARYEVAEVYELPDLNLGRFDYTLFLGVLYHLRHPLRALEIVCGLTKEIAIVDSFVVDHDSRGPITSPIPWMEFYETTELSNQIDNWFGPTLECLFALCRSSGFARVELLGVKHRHARLACYRHWEATPEQPSEPAPVLQAVVNGRYGDSGINFSRRKEEFLTCWFSTPRREVLRQDLRLEVGGLGTQALAVHGVSEGVWQANFILPPGLDAGWQEVRIRTADSLFSNTRRIAVDVPIQTQTVSLRAVSDGRTWSRDEIIFNTDENEAPVTLWIDGLAENRDRNNVRIYCDGHRLPVDFVSDPQVSDTGDTATTQVNARVPRRVGVGEKLISVEFGAARGGPVKVLIR